MGLHAAGALLGTSTASPEEEPLGGTLNSPATPVGIGFGKDGTCGVLLEVAVALALGGTDCVRLGIGLGKGPGFIQSRRVVSSHHCLGIRNE